MQISEFTVTLSNIFLTTLFQMKSHFQHKMHLKTSTFKLTHFSLKKINARINSILCLLSEEALFFGLQADSSKIWLTFNLYLRGCEICQNTSEEKIQNEIQLVKKQKFFYKIWFPC